jgi:hypothetical protein
MIEMWRFPNDELGRGPRATAFSFAAAVDYHHWRDSAAVRVNLQEM